MSIEVVIARAALAAAESQSLIAALNAELSALYDEPGANHFGLTAEETAPGRGAFLVAYSGNEPVGCGAVRLIEQSTGELKRMFVRPDARGRGIGRLLVEALEQQAITLGARRLVLETGTRQLAAIALYQAMGFTVIPLYGEYLRSPDTSICLGKNLPSEAS